MHNRPDNHREFEQLLQEIVSTVPGVVYQFYVRQDGSLGNHFVSQQSKAIFGLDPDPATFMNDFLDQVTPEFRDSMLQSIRDAVHNFTEWVFEGAFRKPSGEMIWFRGHSVPSRRNGEIVFSGVLLDISEQKHAEEGLRQSEEKFSKVFLTTPDAIIITRASDGMIIDANPGFEAITGYSRDEVLGSSTLHILWVDLAEREQLLADLRARGEVLSREFEFRSKDGRHHTGLYSVRSITISGEMCLVFIVLDITERKQAEEALRRSKQQYKELVQNANSVILRWDKHGNITFLNEFGQFLFGYTRDEVLGKNVVGTIVPETETSGRDLIRLMDEIRANPQRYETNVNENMRKNGDRLWIAWTNKPTFDENGQLVEILSVGLDITQRRHAEEALHESEERYRTIFNSSADAFLLFDPDGCITDANPVACEMHGYSKQELVGRSGSDLVAPSYHYQFEQFKQIKSGEWIHFEGANVREDGTEFDVEVFGTRILYGGKQQLLAVLRDVTERNKAREALQMYADIVQNMQVGLYVYCLEDLSDDRTLKLTAANPASTSELGLNTDELLGRYIDEVFPGLREAGLPQRYADVVRTGKSFSIEDLVYSDTRLAQKHYSFEVFPIPGNKVGILFEDITDLKRGEEERQLFYRETISSVTEGRLQVVDGPEIRNYTDSADLRYEINNYADTAAVRSGIKSYLCSRGLNGDELGLFLTGLGEAMTNAIKHAGGGQVSAGTKGDDAWVGVSDTGPGIAALAIPQATLRRGYSTKISMGMGYSIMMEVADRVILSTGPVGTTVILLKGLAEERPIIPLDALPDTWDSIS